MQCIGSKLRREKGLALRIRKSHISSSPTTKQEADYEKLMLAQQQLCWPHRPISRIMATPASTHLSDGACDTADFMLSLAKPPTGHNGLGAKLCREHEVWPPGRYAVGRANVNVLVHFVARQSLPLRAHKESQSHDFCGRVSSYMSEQKHIAATNQANIKILLSCCRAACLTGDHRHPGEHFLWLGVFQGIGCHVPPSSLQVHAGPCFALDASDHGLRLEWQAGMQLLWASRSILSCSKLIHDERHIRSILARRLNLLWLLLCDVREDLQGGKHVIGIRWHKSC